MSCYTGKLSDSEVMDAYERWFNGKEWSPGLNELVDLRDADLSDITNNGVMRLAQYNERVYRSNHVEAVKTAIFAPRDLPYGLARIYTAMADSSPEEVKVFRDFSAAEAWIKNA